MTPISPVYTSHEVRYQLEDSGARAIVCQDILYEKVAKSGARAATGGRHRRQRVSARAEAAVRKKAEVPADGVHWLQELLQETSRRSRPRSRIDP